MAYLNISPEESAIYQLNFSRGLIADHAWTPEQLRGEIVSAETDIARVKIKSDDPHLFQKLDALGFPYSIYSILLHNQIEVSEKESRFSFPELDFELFDGTTANTLQQMVRECIIHRTATNYEDADLRQIITPETELAAADKYVLHFNYRIYPDKRCWLIKKGADYIGYVFGAFRRDAFEGIFYGLIPAYRGTRSYSRVIQQFLKHICWQEKKKFFVNDVVFQNFSSLRPILTEGILPVDSFVNVYFKPFLRYSKISPKIETVHSVPASEPDFFNFMVSKLQGFFEKRERITEYKLAFASYHPEMRNLTFRLSFPVVEEHSKLACLQLFDNKTLMCYCFARIQTI